MFAILSTHIDRSVLNNGTGPNKLHWAGVGLDIISGLALIIIGGLIASGVMTLSPASAFAMLILGTFQLAPYLAGGLLFGGHMLRFAAEKKCCSNPEHN